MNTAPRLEPTHPLAVALAADRERYNALFEVARARHDTLDGGDVAAVLAETLAPLVEGDKASPVLDALFPFVLDAVGKAHIGPSARQPDIDVAWRQALLGSRRHLERDPARLATAILTALRTLAATPGAQPLRWARRFAELASLAATADELLNAGAVLAWREGLARLRTAALRTSSELPSALALSALGVPDTSGHRDALATALDRLRSNPWRTPEQAFTTPRGDAELALQRVCGGFRGFGGPFLRPPTVVASSSGLIASDGDRWFRLHADVFGTAFERIGDFEAESTVDHAPWIGTSGVVQWGNRQTKINGLAHVMSQAATETTLAAVIPKSHRIALIAPGG